MVPSKKLTHLRKSKKECVGTSMGTHRPIIRCCDCLLLAFGEVGLGWVSVNLSGFPVGSISKAGKVIELWSDILLFEDCMEITLAHRTFALPVILF